MSTTLAVELPQTAAFQSDRDHTPNITSSRAAASLEEAPPGVTVATVKQRWNDPPINKYKVAVTFLSFFIVGANDAAYGALIPSLRTYYNLSTSLVSVIFITPFAGYTMATVSVTKIHMTLGQRGIAIIGPLCHLIPFAILSAKPPFPVVVCVYGMIGMGNGLVDAAWSAWVGDMVNANAIMGCLHACYGAGGTASPTIATSMIGAGLGWWSFYYLMAGACVLELVTSVTGFWCEDGETFRRNNARTEPDQGGGSRTTEAMKNRIVWTLALLLFTYMGVEVAIGGWLVEFMRQERHGANLESGLVSTGFWLGITVGRLVLGFVNDRLGERVALMFYLGLAIVFELLFWLISQFVVSAVMVAFLGFFIGPLFPVAMVVAAKLLPKHLHTAGIGFASALGGGGAAVLPFIAGLIAQAKGVQSLQPFALSLLVVLVGLWLVLPRKATEHET
ncbi:Protein TsgA homolog [Talaromyces islandicus]|uniref:Protein TsgA homolog n=1 Tax=Talaromyces islandicus TaxID=28573 RepID=A0A0U1LKY7_TALIS|nr:Protein TsgA homolog [Talaromyces islandicus]